MADYWKSQPRHFCEFCKCWTADNKPSKEFHERGKRHQENVQKKLDELRRKGLADAKREREMSSYLEEMEKGALAKLKDDLTSDPKLASQYGVIIKSKKNVKTEEKSTDSGGEGVSEEAGGEWCEATTPEGYVYYWNTVTRESRWEPPVIPDKSNQGEAEPVKAEEEEKEKEEEEETAVEEAAPVVKKPKFSSKGKVKEPKSEEVKTDVASSEEQKDVGSSSPAETLTISSCEPRTSQRSAYGKWEEIKEEITEPSVVDLELPVDANADATEQKTIVIHSEPKIKFQEKKVTSLSVSGASSSGGTTIGFRKSKFGAQRNLRTADDLEDS